MTTDPSPPPDADAALPVPAAALPSLAALLAALLRRDGDGLTLQDATSGTYLYADAIVAQWWGHDGDTLIGRGGAELFEPGVVTALRAAEQAALVQAAAIVSEHRFDVHGARREFSVLRQRLDGGSDGPPLLAAVWRDLTPLRRREAQRTAALEQLEQQQRANEQLRREMQDHGRPA